MENREKKLLVRASPLKAHAYSILLAIGGIFGAIIGTACLVSGEIGVSIAAFIALSVLPFWFSQRLINRSGKQILSLGQNGISHNKKLIAWNEIQYVSVTDNENNNGKIRLHLKNGKSHYIKDGFYNLTLGEIIDKINERIA